MFKLKVSGQITHVHEGGEGTGPTGHQADIQTTEYENGQVRRVLVRAYIPTWLLKHVKYCHGKKLRVLVQVDKPHIDRAKSAEWPKGADVLAWGTLDYVEIL